jgi:hypothetical protein
MAGTLSPYRPAAPLRSADAVVAGIVPIIVLSLAADSLLHALGVYPPWGEPMHEPELNALALAYRVAFTVFGGYLTARLAPHGPVGHALALGGIGLVLGTAGAVAAWEMSPAWFLILVAMSGLPCAWAGGRLALAGRRSAERTRGPRFKTRPHSSEESEL